MKIRDQQNDQLTDLQYKNDDLMKQMLNKEKEIEKAKQEKQNLIDDIKKAENALEEQKAN